MKITSSNISQIVGWLRNKGPVMYLESQMKGHPSSQKSYLAGMPVSWIKIKSGTAEICEEGVIQTTQVDSWEALKTFRKKHHEWLFGYVGYDLKNDIEELVSENEDLFDAPDLFFFSPSFLLEIDAEGNIKPIKGDLPDLSEIVKQDKIELHLSQKISQPDYTQAIEAAKKDIYEGEYYEVNLSHPLIFNFEGDSWQLYQKMKEAGPVPFGGYLSFDEFTVCCSSPERFLAKRGNRVWSQPIKGTAPREKSTDHSQVSRLKQSIKERAENLMIVDLVRNDLSHFAKKNSVWVRDLFEIQSFETVHQMVSTIECEVDEKVNAIELIKSCFPMGSMTGAPKIAAMQAIEKLENYRRGIYSGAMGYLNPANDFDFNVIIRTALIKNKTLIYPVGGAITSDSDPNEEWEETLLKARAITKVAEM